MGYNTIFTGSFQFAKKLTKAQKAYLLTIVDEDCRDHPEWKAGLSTYGLSEVLTHMDMRITEDGKGIEWNSDTEKTYDFDDKLNVMLRLMQAKWPDFSFKGGSSITAQGEDEDDKWVIHFGCINQRGHPEDRFYRRNLQKVYISGADDKSFLYAEVKSVRGVVECPHCTKEFVLGRGVMVGNRYMRPHFKHDE